MRGEADIARLLEAGNVHRAVAAHNLNEHSSRSCARTAPAYHGACPALLVHLDDTLRWAVLQATHGSAVLLVHKPHSSPTCAALREYVCSFPGRLPTCEWLIGTRSARCSWSSGARSPRRRRPAATASCAPSCTWWTWQARPLPAPAWQGHPHPRVPHLPHLSWHWGCCGLDLEHASRVARLERMQELGKHAQGRRERAAQEANA